MEAPIRRGRKEDGEMSLSRSQCITASGTLWASIRRMRSMFPLLCCACLLLFLAQPLLESQTGVSPLVVVSSASYSATLAPGSLGTILGAGLSINTAQAEIDQNGNFPTELAGTTVQINGTLAQLLFVSAGQINFLMPTQAQPGSTAVVVKTSAGLTLQGTATVQTVAPGIFTADASGHGAILNAVTFSVGPFRPETAENPGCDKRTRLAIFGTGMRLAAAGSVRVQVKDSAGVVSLLTVEYSGAAQTPGLDQVNVVFPADFNASGTLSLTILAGSASSNTVTFDLNVRDQASVSADACLIDLNAGSVTVNSGAQMTATLSLSAPAASGGVLINLSSNSPAVQVPGSVMIPAGQTSATFQLTAASTPSAQNVTITASLNGISKTLSLVVNPPCIGNLGLSASVVAGGTGLTGTVQLSAPAPDGGLVVNLQSSDPHVQVDASVTIPAGKTSADFSISTTPGSATLQAAITASVGGCAGVSVTITVNVNACVAAVNLSANAVIGGTSLTGTVMLTAPAPSGGLVVNLQSNNAQVQVTATVTVPAGQTSASFNISTSAGSTSASAAITASLNGCAAISVSLTVNPPSCVASVSLSSNTVTGGNSLTGTVALTAPAPSGGLVVNLQSNNAQVQVGATVTVPAGQTSASFNISTSAGSTNASATITASLNGCARASATLTVNPVPGVVSVSLSASAVTGGASLTGTVTLTGPAPSGGLVVSLQSNNAQAQLAANVTVAGGQTSANFNVSTSPVASSVAVTITATLNGSASATFTINPPCVSSVSLSSDTVTGGSSVTGTVTLNGSAPSGGLVVNLKSDNSQVQVGATVTVPAGQTTAGFNVSTTAGQSKTSANISVSVGNCAGVSVVLTVNPTPCVASVALSVNAVTGGAGLTGTVTLTAAAPAGGLIVNLQSNNPLVQVAASVTVPAGQTSVNFAISTAAPSAVAAASITASLSGCAAVSATLTLNPAVCVSAVSLSANAVIGGNTLTGTVILNGQAPAGGLIVNLQSNNPLVQVAASVMVPAGQTSANFTVSANPTATNVAAAITASIGLCSATVSVTVNAASLTNLGLSAATLIGGNGLTGTVTLNGNAPAGGAVVSLSSGNLLVSVPATVTISPGQSSAAFSVSTSPVLVALNVGITATYNGAMKTATVMLTPLY